MKTEKIDLSRLRNEEHYQFQTDFKESVDQYGADKLNIDTPYSSYKGYYDQEEEALLLVRKNPTTEDLAIADDERDGIFRGFADNVKSALNHHDPAKRPSARRFQILLDQYGNVAQKPYDEETAAISKLIQEAEGPHAADITLLGLNDWIIALDAKNKFFDSLMKGRYSEEAVKTQLRMKQVRIQVDSAYRDIIDRLDALMLINGSTNYEPFVRELNIRVERYSNMLAQRKGRAVKNEEKAQAQNQNRA